MKETVALKIRGKKHISLKLHMGYIWAKVSLHITLLQGLIFFLDSQVWTP